MFYILLYNISGYALFDAGYLFTRIPWRASVVPGQSYHCPVQVNLKVIYKSGHQCVNMTLIYIVLKVRQIFTFQTLMEIMTISVE